jgi:breast cancer metastasis-suppressor 1-like protein
LSSEQFCGDWRVRVCLRVAEMPPMKLQSSGGGDVSDGNVSGAESERSNTSRENDAGRDSSEDEADSDDSSEMDEGECENRRNELLQHVQDLENQFGHLREQLYKERMAQVTALLCVELSG